MTKKEMTEYGPRQLLGDYLEACIHQSFTMDADYLLKDGKLTRDERIVLSNAIGSALDTFHNAVPEEIRARVIGPSYEDMMQPATAMRGLSKFFDHMSQSVKTLFGVEFVEEKATFDESSWNGSASQWDTAAAYCADCLIDENDAGMEKTKDKCHLPYRKPGSNSINKNALRAIASGGRGIPALKGVSSDEKTKAANFVIRHWKTAFGTSAPDSMYRIAGKTPPGREEKSAFRLVKDIDGGKWAILVYSNKWADRVEDILSEKSHEKFADWVNTSGFRPQITLFHLPHLPSSFWIKVFKKYHNDIPVLNAIVKKVFRDTGLAIAEVERVVYLNGFSMMIGKVYPDMEEIADKLAETEDVGSSHAFLVGDFTPREEKGMIVEEYLTFEGTALPRSCAANPVTMYAVEDKEMADKEKETKLKMTDEDRQWMEKLFGVEGMKKIDANTEALASNLNGLLAFKQMMEDEPEEEEDPKKGKKPAAKKEIEEKPADAPPVEEAPKPESTPVDVKAIAGEVIKALNVEELQRVIGELSTQNKELADKVAALSTEVSGLKKTDDEKVAEKIAPIAWGAPVFQPSKSTPESKKTPEEVKKEAPHNPDAKAADPNNVMNLGLLSMFGQQQ